MNAPIASPEPSYANRRWVGWLVFALFLGLLIFGRIFNTPASALPPPIATTQPLPATLSLALLTICRQPDRVGAFVNSDRPCEPLFIWTLTDFAEQLVPLGLLAEGESLGVPPNAADLNCPLIILREMAASGARLCFSSQGGVYRDVGDQRGSAWAWRPTLEGRWLLDRSASIPIAKLGN